jgi:hypothetical protein
MEALIKLISVENSVILIVTQIFTFCDHHIICIHILPCPLTSQPIEFLSLADSRLKQSITLLFDSLGTNESLVELDIR